MADGRANPKGSAEGSALRTFIEHKRFEQVVLVLILVNAVTLGLETSQSVMARFGGLLKLIDQAILAVFVVELALKGAVYKARFFRDPWSLFDLAVVAVSLIPATGNLSVLRAFRILRVLRLVRAIPAMRRVVEGLLAAIPGMGSIAALLALIFYVFAVMATKLFGVSHPEWFGNLPASAFTLFQVMTLEGWADGIVRPVMAEFPWAWAFFITFILITSFAVLSLFIGIIVEAMQSHHKGEIEDTARDTNLEAHRILEEVQELRAEIRALKASLESR